MFAQKSRGAKMRDIAEKAGVSISTVSHVINKTRAVSAESEEKVLAAIDALNYKQNKTRKPSKIVSVGVILADAREDYYVEMVKVMESVAKDYGLSLVYCDSEANAAKEKENIDILLSRGVGGIILAPISASKQPLALEKCGVPVILYDRQFNEHNFTFVGINNFQSAYDGVIFLQKKGCKRIGFVGYQGDVWTIKQRVLGYTAALKDKRLGAAKTLLLKYHAEDSLPRIEEFIVKGKFDGVIFGTSTACYETISALDAMSAKGTAPHALPRLLSYDDNRWLDFLKYKVSVITQPVAEIAAAAVEALYSQICAKTEENLRKKELLFDTGLVERD